MILYEHPLSPYAQKVKIALRHKGVAFDLKRPDGIGSGQVAGDFGDGNPRGEVPFLIDGDLRIFDSTIMLDYVEERWPAPALMPEDPAARARMRMIEDVMDTHYEAINWGLGEMKYFRRAEGELAETLHSAAAAQTHDLQAWLTAQLGSVEWFGGESFGRADLSVAPYLNSSAGFGLGPADGSPLAAWLVRVNAVESVRQTADEAAASIATIGKAYRAVESGAFKRQYRDHRLEWMIRSGGIDVVRKGLEKGDIRFTGGFSGPLANPEH
ncbi:MAG: glutathione S-transferase family protein [Minwuia sp.]|uniref:glutathione S-transferase family protein n=1 Tax=Minwuia sp. TaxID=2493630 RepID=UPI003A8BDA93